MTLFRASIKSSILLGLCAVFLLSGFGLKACSRPPAEAMKPITLTWWRVFDSDKDFTPALARFKGEHPNINVEYRRLRFEEYESELLNALAEDRGPDIISLHNTWIGKYQSKLEPMPPSVTLPYTFTQGTIKKETITELRTKPSPSTRDIKNAYLDVVANDVIRAVPGKSGQPPADRVFGLPLSVDTLALYYNRDLLNTARIPEPAKTWTEFQEQIPKLTRIDGTKIVQAGAAIGATDNIPRATDLLSLLMIQNGTVMADDRYNATFQRVPIALQGRPTPPAEEALAFYTDFSNPGKEAYTWNADMGDALDLFTQGRLAYFFGYSYHLSTIRARAPKLRFGIAPVPQIEGNPEANYANYWVETVSKKSKNPSAAWGFIQFITDVAQVESYLTSAKHPPALRSLIPKFTDDLDLTVFTNQLFTSTSWYRGNDAGAVETILKEMIQHVVTGRETIQQAINSAVGKVNQTITN